MTQKERTKIGLRAAMTALAVIAVFAHVYTTRAIFVSSPTIPRSAGDTSTSEILNQTILDEDVSDVARISATKVAPKGTQGMILLSDGTNIATSTSFVVATATPVLSVIGGRISATSTSFNGVNMTWPSADGTNGQSLQTNGSGVLSWATVSTGFSMTAGQTVVAGDPVTIEPNGTTAANIAYANDVQAFDFGLTTQASVAQVIEPATAKLITGVTIRVLKVNSPTDNVIVALVSDLSGFPDTSHVLASSTIVNAKITTSAQDIPATFTKAVYVPANTKLWIWVYNESKVLSGTNYFDLRQGGLGTCTGDCVAYYNAGWVNYGSRGIFMTVTDAGTTKGSVYVAGAAIATSSATTTVGLINAGVSTSSSATVMGSGNTVSGIQTGVIGKTFYLDDAIGQIASSSGRVAKALGIMIGAAKGLLDIRTY